MIKLAIAFCMSLFLFSMAQAKTWGLEKGTYTFKYDIQMEKKSVQKMKCNYIDQVCTVEALLDNEGQTESCSGEMIVKVTKYDSESTLQLEHDGGSSKYNAFIYVYTPCGNFLDGSLIFEQVKVLIGADGRARNFYYTNGGPFHQKVSGEFRVSPTEGFASFSQMKDLYKQGGEAHGGLTIKKLKYVFQDGLIEAIGDPVNAFETTHIRGKYTFLGSEKKN